MAVMHQDKFRLESYKEVLEANELYNSKCPDIVKCGIETIPQYNSILVYRPTLSTTTCYDIINA